METSNPDPLAELADALGALRAEIRALKARESALRDAVLAARPNGPVTGARFELRIRESQRRILARDRLPAEILNDPCYWSTRSSQTVVTTPCANGREAATDIRREAAPETRREAAPGPGRAAAAGSGRAAARNNPPTTPSAPLLDLWGEAEEDPVLIEDF